MSTIAGIFGSITAFIAAIISGAVAITVVYVLWQSGAIPGLIELAGTFLALAGSAISGFFGFLTELVGAFS
jgi:hypothetical protein